MLHSSFIYGPVRSRRFGSSLGINLLPTGRKICNFECVYCECGWTNKHSKSPLPSVTDVSEMLESQLEKMKLQNELPDHITFAGNGEPTLHPAFVEIMDRTIEIRNAISPKSQITVLSNATRLNKTDIRAVLMKIDNRVLKLDAGTEEMFQRIDLPETGITLEEITRLLEDLGGDVTIQTMFHKGEHRGQSVDNSSNAEIRAWIARLIRIRPKLVMIYTLDRKPSADQLVRLQADELAQIAEQVRKHKIAAEYFA